MVKIEHLSWLALCSVVQTPVPAIYPHSDNSNRALQTICTKSPPELLVRVGRNPDLRLLREVPKLAEVQAGDANADA